MNYDDGKLNSAISISKGEIAAKAQSIIGLLQGLKIPEDEDGKLNFSNVNSRAATIKSNANQVADLIEAFLQSAKAADAQAEQLATGLSLGGLDFSGNGITLSAGDKFYASASGLGGNGTVGNGSRPAGDGYVIDRLAIEVDGKLVENMPIDSTTKEDLNKLITEYAEKNNIDPAKITVTPHVSYESNGQKMDTGWLSDKKMTMDEVSKTDVVENTIDKINEQYKNRPVEQIKNGTVDIKSETKENPFDAFTIWETKKNDTQNVQGAGTGETEVQKAPTYTPPKDGNGGITDIFSPGTTDFGKAGFEQFMPGLNLTPLDELTKGDKKDELFYHPGPSLNGQKYEENIENGLLKDKKLTNVVKQYDIDLSKYHYSTNDYTYVNNGKGSYLELGNGIKIHDNNTITVPSNGKDVEVDSEIFKNLASTQAKLNEPVKDHLRPDNMTSIESVTLDFKDDENNQTVLTFSYFEGEKIRVAEMDGNTFVVGTQESADDKGNATDSTTFGYSVDEKGELVPISIFGEYNKDSLQYGGNQNMFGWRGVDELLADEKIWGVLEERYPGSTYEQKRAYLSCMAGKCCGFVANVNGIFDHYEGKEEEFKETFGIDMYKMDENGKLDYNWEYLTLKYWDYVYGKVADRSIGQMSGGRYGLTPTEHALFDDFLKDEFKVKAESTTYLNSKYDTHHIEDTITGSDTSGSIVSGQQTVMDIYEELSKKYESISVGQRSGSEGHAMYVVGKNENDNLDLSSLGKLEHPNYGCRFKFYVVDYKD